MYDDQNIFAKILRGEIPNNTVYEDDYALAFYDIEPKAPIHVLIIPKEAYVTMDDFAANASNGEIAGFWRAFNAVVEKLDLAENGYRLINNARNHGMQEVPHMHVHILAGEPMGAMR